MSNSNIYDPEDLELLMKSKSFSELLPEEKAFVLQHVENDAEYDTMRDTLLNLNMLPELEPAIAPKESTRDALMSAFEAAHSTPLITEEKEEKSKLAAWWLWFWDTNKSMFQRPAFQLASLALVVSLVTYVGMFNPDNTVAELQEKDQKTASKELVKETEQKKEQNETNKAADSEQSSSEEKINSAPEEEVVLEALEEAEAEAEETKALEDISEDKVENGYFTSEIEVPEEVMDLVAEEESQNKNELLITKDSNEGLAENVQLEFQDASEDAGLVYSPASPEVILVEPTYTINPDVRSALGNSTTLSDYDFDEVTASAEMDLNKKALSAPAKSAASFSNLLSKLHTSE